MKVKELIAELSDMPEESEVVLQTYGMDSEMWSHTTMYGYHNMKVSIDDMTNSVVIYGEEEE